MKQKLSNPYIVEILVLVLTILTFIVTLHFTNNREVAISVAFGVIFIMPILILVYINKKIALSTIIVIIVLAIIYYGPMLMGKIFDPSKITIFIFWGFALGIYQLSTIYFCGTFTDLKMEEKLHIFIGRAFTLAIIPYFGNQVMNLLIK